MKSKLEGIKKWMVFIVYTYKVYKTDIEADLLFPIWEKLEDKCLKPLFCYIGRFIPGKARRYMHAIIFSISNRSLKRIVWTFSLWTLLFISGFIYSIVHDIDFMRKAVLLCIYAAIGFLLIEYIILQYHIVRIFGKVKDQYIPPYSRKKDSGFMPLTNGRWIKNNLWFYQIFDASQFTWRSDLSDIQAFIHGEQYTSCNYNILIYWEIIIGFSLIYALG